MNNKLVSLKKASEILGVTRQTLLNWCQSGSIPHVVVGHINYIQQTVIDKLTTTTEDVEESRKKLEAIKRKYDKECEDLKELIEELRDEKDTRAYLSVCMYNSVHAGFFSVITNLLYHTGEISETEKMIIEQVLRGISLKDVALNFGYTREHIRQTADKVIRKSHLLKSLKPRLEKARLLEGENRELTRTLDGLRYKLAEIEHRASEVPKSMRDEMLEKFSELINIDDITVRTANTLRYLDVKTVGDLCRLHTIDILAVRNVGRKTLAEIKDYLDVRGLSLGMDVSKYYV